jgi:sporulation protein YlmC with PRC-barrel domain
MKVTNPKELVGKEVYDTTGNTIGKIDKTWNSWNQDYPGYFFGIRPNESTRYTWFRGTTKLIPIYSDYIRECGENVTLNKTIEDLSRFWNKTVHFGQTSWPTDELVEKPVYDRNFSRVGTFYSWVESDGTYKNYGVFLDPYLCETWNWPYNTLMPLCTDYICDVKDAVWLNKSLDEMKTFWQQNYQFS